MAERVHPGQKGTPAGGANLCGTGSPWPNGYPGRRGKPLLTGFVNTNTPNMDINTIKQCKFEERSINFCSQATDNIFHLLSRDPHIIRRKYWGKCFDSTNIDEAQVKND